MTLVLDAGALIAAERSNRDVVALLKLKAELRAGLVPLTHGGIVGQVWHDGARQATLARLLAGVEVVPMDDALGRRAGVLLARADADDLHDAVGVLLAADGDAVLTSDLRGISALAAADGARVDTVTVQEAKTHLSALLHAVEDGEEIEIRRGSRPVARLVPASATRTVAELRGIFAGRASPPPPSAWDPDPRVAELFGTHAAV
jgi:prevent-host-death family protein